MPRKKKALPNRPDGRYEIKVTVGKGYDGTPIRKSFYSTISRDDAKRQADEYKIEMEVANRTGVGFISRDISFSEWAIKWAETYKKPDVSENTYARTYLNTINNHLNPYFGKTCLQDIGCVLK